MAYAKGSAPQDASYAKGGAALGKTSPFYKTPDEFRDPSHGKMERPGVVGDLADADQKYGKSGAGAGKGMVEPPAAKDKCLPAVKPR